MPRYAARIVEGCSTLSLIEDIAEHVAGFNRRLDAMRAAVAAAGLEPEVEPEQPDPRWCCGRGCHPCIFTVYFEAAEAWMARARQRIAAARP